MATIIISHRTTVAMTNSIHALLSENHPCTLLMVASIGYHDPPISIHYNMLRSDDGAAPGGVLCSNLAASSTGAHLGGLVVRAPGLSTRARGSPSDAVPVRGVMLT